jgi:uncharacterized protein (TIGR02117 family)
MGNMKRTHRRGRDPLATLAVVAFTLLALGCAAQQPHGDATTPDAHAASHRIHAVRHGWHSSIVVRAADVPFEAWPSRREFADAEYIEVGWGNRAYYQVQNPSVWLGLRALLWPSAGVLHMVAFSGPVEREFAVAEIVALHITPQGLARLVAAIAASHERDAAGLAIALGPGLYGRSRFYASRDRFHLFSTCNVWTSDMLREAGVPLGPLLSPSAGALFSQLRRLGAAAPAVP